jgi:uncharacterized protein (DUF1778 family)
MSMKKASKKTQRAPGQTTLTISLPEEMKERIEAAAEADGRSISNFMVRELTRLLIKENPKGGSEAVEIE